jgi:hypothetical protein
MEMLWGMARRRRHRPQLGGIVCLSAYACGKARKAAKGGFKGGFKSNAR